MNRPTRIVAIGASAGGLESLERLVEKVGRIDLHATDGQGLDALLTKLVRLKTSESA